jgi:hypothetical protein
MRSYVKVETKEPILSQIQDNLIRALAPLLLSVLLDAQQLESVQLTAGTVNRIPHKLGRKLRGFWICRQRGQATIWDGQDSNQRPDLLLDLHTNNTVNVDLLVF